MISLTLLVYLMASCQLLKPAPKPAPKRPTTTRPTTTKPSTSKPSTTKPSTTKPPTTTTEAEIKIEGPANAVNYLTKYKGIAVAEMKRTGVPASIKLAQAVLESGYGSSELSTKANNHFGIKCGSAWKGKTYYLKSRGACFRAYSSAEQSFKEHSDFLKAGKHYASLFKLKVTDYKGWADGLEKAGYATNKDYSDKLIELIERYKLYQFDK